MIAVVYSGSNYADWRLAEREKTVATFKTQGINPYLTDEKAIISLLKKNINLIHHAEEIKKIYFFTAGASSPGRVQTVHNALGAFFKHAKITVEHDIVAAAIASCREKKGIVCIIGSGANAALYDGKKIINNNYGLGYILADEGSASWMGKTLLKNFINETLPEKLAHKFKKRYDYDRKQILDKVYRQPQPALFLSSFTDFFAENQADEYINNIISTGFKLFLNTYIAPLLKQEPQLPVFFVGSVAATFQVQLLQITAEMDIAVAGIIKEPINNLLKYYSSKN